MAIPILRIKDPNTDQWVEVPAIAGASAYQVAVSNGYSGTEDQWLESLKGEPGKEGAPGKSATITIGSTTTGEPGTQAAVTNSGTDNAAVLDFVIPRGETGPQGPAGNLNTPLTGLNIPSSPTAITAQNTILEAFGNLQGQIDQGGGDAPSYKTMETISIYGSGDYENYDIDGLIIGRSGFQSGTKAFWGLGMSLNTSESVKNYMIGCYSIPTEAGAATYIGGIPIYRRLLPSANSFSINPGDIVTKNLTATGSCSLGSLDYDGGTIGWQAGAVATITTLGAYNLNFTDPDTADPTGSSTMYFGPGYDEVNPTAMTSNQICVYSIAYDGQHFLINRAIYTNKNA